MTKKSVLKRILAGAMAVFLAGGMIVPSVSAQKEEQEGNKTRVTIQKLLSKEDFGKRIENTGKDMELSVFGKNVEA